MITLPKPRPYTISCGALGGRSKRTGKPVGRNHRWNGGSTCEFCGNSKDYVRVPVKPDAPP